MKKEGIVIVCILLIGFLSIGLVSAGWFGDLWGKITGKVIIEDPCGGADLDEDGDVDLDDFVLIKQKFGCDVSDANCSRGDADRDGDVDLVFW